MTTVFIKATTPEGYKCGLQYIHLLRNTMQHLIDSKMPKHTSILVYQLDSYIAIWNTLARSVTIIKATVKDYLILIFPEAISTFDQYNDALRNIIIVYQITQDAGLELTLVDDDKTIAAIKKLAKTITTNCYQGTIQPSDTKEYYAHLTVDIIAEEYIDAIDDSGIFAFANNKNWGFITSHTYGDYVHEVFTGAHWGWNLNLKRWQVTKNRRNDFLTDKFIVRAKDNTITNAKEVTEVDTFNYQIERRELGMGKLYISFMPQERPLFETYMSYNKYLRDATYNKLISDRDDYLFANIIDKTTLLKDEEIGNYEDNGYYWIYHVPIACVGKGLLLYRSVELYQCVNGLTMSKAGKLSFDGGVMHTQYTGDGANITGVAGGSTEIWHGSVIIDAGVGSCEWTERLWFGNTKIFEGKVTIIELTIPDFNIIDPTIASWIHKTTTSSYGYGTGIASSVVFGAYNFVPLPIANCNIQLNINFNVELLDKFVVDDSSGYEVTNIVWYTTNDTLQTSNGAFQRNTKGDRDINVLHYDHIGDDWFVIYKYTNYNDLAFWSIRTMNTLSGRMGEWTEQHTVHYRAAYSLNGIGNDIELSSWRKTLSGHYEFNPQVPYTSAEYVSDPATLSATGYKVKYPSCQIHKNFCVYTYCLYKPYIENSVVKFSFYQRIVYLFNYKTNERYLVETYDDSSMFYDKETQERLFGHAAAIGVL